MAAKSEPAGSHSRLPPSGSARWSVCTASLKFIEDNAHLLPKQNWTFAERGTRAHDAGAKLILDPHAQVVVDDDEMLTSMKGYAEFVRTKIEPGDRVLVERKVRLFYLPTEKGTVDAAIIGPKRIYIADYKDGVGVGVYAKENTQLASYAESLVRELELIEEVPDDLLVTLAIYQPRDRVDPNPIRLWNINRGVLREFTRKIEEAKDRIFAGQLELKAGPHCDKSFCPARGLCPSYASLGLEPIGETTTTLVDKAPARLPVPESISRAQRQRILGVKSAVIAWLEAIENQEVAELMNGAPPEQFKLVEGKTNRQWVDESKVKILLETHLKPEQVTPPVEPSVVSPAQAEKLLKGIKTSSEFNASLSALITKPAGRPTLVPITDKRPALMLSPTDGLSNIETSELI